MYKRIIATGHHLEWLAIAPRELHPPREQILKAADWIIKATIETPDDVIEAQYTFFSHVGSGLALWRGTRPSAFWKSHEASTTEEAAAMARQTNSAAPTPGTAEEAEPRTAPPTGTL